MKNDKQGTQYTWLPVLCLPYLSNYIDNVTSQLR